MGVQAPLDAVAVIGAGVIGCAIAYALAREGRQVILIDRDEPGRAGASFGNVGHIAAELVEPLPSPQLLFGFWRELSAFGGPVSIQAGHFRQFAPWARRFAALEAPVIMFLVYSMCPGVSAIMNFLLSVEK